MSPSTPSRNPRRVRPQDPAIWVWAAVALIALVPLQHAVASRLERVHPHTVQPATSADAATPRARQAAPSGTPVQSGAGADTRPQTTGQAPVGAGIATP